VQQAVHFADQRSVQDFVFWVCMNVKMHSALQANRLVEWRLGRRRQVE
jgi:hypothetical protein